MTLILPTTIHFVSCVFTSKTLLQHTWLTVFICVDYLRCFQRLWRVVGIAEVNYYSNFDIHTQGTSESTFDGNIIWRSLLHLYSNRLCMVKVFESYNIARLKQSIYWKSASCGTGPNAFSVCKLLWILFRNFMIFCKGVLMQKSDFWVIIILQNA